MAQIVSGASSSALVNDREQLPIFVIKFCKPPPYSKNAKEHVNQLIVAMTNW
jgi:hypothetical protein